MVHPDYQYDPKVIPQLIEPIKKGGADAVFGSRMMKGGALEGGMPLWKHNANILLTAVENVMLPALIQKNGRLSGEAKVKAESLLERVGLSVPQMRNGPCRRRLRNFLP